MYEAMALFIFKRRLPESPEISGPVDNSQHPACKDAVEDHRSGDGEDFASDAEYLSFFFILDGRRGYAVGKAGDGDQCAGAAPFGDGGIDIKAGQKDT